MSHRKVKKNANCDKSIPSDEIIVYCTNTKMGRHHPVFITQDGAMFRNGDSGFDFALPSSMSITQKQILYIPICFPDRISFLRLKEGLTLI